MDAPPAGSPSHVGSKGLTHPFQPIEDGEHFVGRIIDTGEATNSEPAPISKIVGLDLLNTKLGGDRIVQVLRGEVLDHEIVELDDAVVAPVDLIEDGRVGHRTEIDERFRTSLPEEVLQSVKIGGGHGPIDTYAEGVGHGRACAREQSDAAAYFKGFDSRAHGQGAAIGGFGGFAAAGKGKIGC